MVPKAVVGHPAPGFSALSSDGYQRSLTDHAGHNLLLVFNRYLGSRPCREHARALWHNRERLAALDTGVLLVSFESMEHIGWYLTGADAPWPILSDPHRRIYHAYGLGRSGVASDWLSARTATDLVSRMFQPGAERTHADAHQTGGDFLIDADGILRFAYRCRGPVDRPPVDELLLELRRLPAA